MPKSIYRATFISRLISEEKQRRENFIRIYLRGILDNTNRLWREINPFLAIKDATKLFKIEKKVQKNKSKTAVLEKNHRLFSVP